jgi:hypothetical protein
MWVAGYCCADAPGDKSYLTCQMIRDRQRERETWRDNHADCEWEDCLECCGSASAPGRPARMCLHLQPCHHRSNLYMERVSCRDCGKSFLAVSKLMSCNLQDWNVTNPRDSGVHLLCLAHHMLADSGSEQSNSPMFHSPFAHRYRE